MDVVHAFTLAQRTPFLVVSTNLGGIRVLRGDTMTLVYTAGAPEDRVAGVVGGREGLGFCEAWLYALDPPA
jgi:hypothetical protein